MVGALQQGVPAGSQNSPSCGPGDDLRASAARGVRGIVLCPVGFVCDHVEVLYDLDVEAAAVARATGLEMQRASSVNAHPAFIGALADAVRSTIDRYRNGRPLPIVTAAINQAGASLV
jgi:ferrochelatase